MVVMCTCGVLMAVMCTCGGVDGGHVYLHRRGGGGGGGGLMVVMFMVVMCTCGGVDFYICKQVPEISKCHVTNTSVFLFKCPSPKNRFVAYFSTLRQQINTKFGI